MTEQRKIPLPGDREKRVKTLFERAGHLLGTEGFSPAPVPKDLAVPARPRSRSEASAKMRTRKPLIEQPSAEPVELAVTPTLPPKPPLDHGEALQFPEERHPINRNFLRERGMIVPDEPASALMEEFRIVKRQLLSAARESLQRGSDRSQRVLICSPLPGEGKTFCAVNLALAIAAEKDSEVLLVDADFAKPSILSLLGLPKGPGLMDALANPSTMIEDCIIGTDVPGLHVLPAGARSNADSEFLASRRTEEVLDRLTKGAPNRIVIFDSPPALAASPAAELAKHVGQTLVVARADTTGQSALEDTLSLLSNCSDIKLLLNAVHFSPSGRRFGTYYGYGG